MRISTAAMQRLAIDAILNQQSTLSRTQLQVASGERIVQPSDDPIGAQRVLELDAALKRVDQYQVNANLVRSRLSLSESALADATQVIQRARELVVQASNDTQGSEARGQIAAEIRELADALLGIANSQNGQGEYLFSGYRTETQPFARTAGSVAYQGDQGQRLLRISDGLTVPDGDPGNRVFASIASGNGTFEVAANSANTGSGIAVPEAVVDSSAYDGDTYTVRFTTPTAYEIVDSGGGAIQTGAYVSGESITFRGIQIRLEGEPATSDEFVIAPSTKRDVFSMLDDIASALEASGDNPAARAQTRVLLNGGLQNLDQALGHLQSVRTEVGIRLATLDTQDAANEDYALTLQSTRSEIADLDYAEAVGRLNLQLVGLQAAQQAFARVQGLSLFNFL